MTDIYEFEDGTVGYDLGGGSIMIRTPNATITIKAGKDYLGHELTSCDFVPDEPFTTMNREAAAGSESLFTLHPETATAGEN